MAQNGYGPTAGHMGRIPNYGKSQPTSNPEPPACIQNAMMTKDKKPFTYTPGGLDLSQIKTPSMARRLARQRSQEEHEQAWAQQQPNHGHQHQGVPAPPPPPPPQAPPPPPPLIIPNQPPSKSPKPFVPGERPEIVIPENPIGMLRKTNSPYHWESEQADLQRMSQMPKFVEKVPSPLTVNRPSQGPSNFQNQNYPSKQPESPIYRPEAQYAHQNSSSPNINGSPQTRETLQRQDSQFNKSPQPFAGQSPLSNGSQYSPSPNNNWREPERRDSPLSTINSSPISPQVNRSPFSPNVQQFSPSSQIQSPPVNKSPVYSTLPRSGQRNQDYANNAPYNHSNANNNYNNPIFNNVKEVRPQSPSIIQPDPSNPTPWRTNALNRQSREPESQQTIYHNSQKANQQPTYSPPWQTNETNNNKQVENSYIPPWKQENKSREHQIPNQPQQYSPPWIQDVNNNRAQENLNSSWKTPSTENKNVIIPNQNQPQQQPRYQSTMSIPVTPRKPNQPPPLVESNGSAPQKEIVYVTEEPVYYCPDSPNSIPPWVKTQKEKTKTPPPEWCQRPLEGRPSAPRELVTPPRETSEPEWVKKSNEMQRGVRDLISPPKYQQPVQPTWSTRPSENRKSLPRDNPPSVQTKMIPIQIEGSSNRSANHHPQLRVTIDLQNPQNQASLSQPTQRIMRVLSPQLVRMDDNPGQPELPTLNRNYYQESHTNKNQQSNLEQHKTRIIPIQIEGGNAGANHSFGGRY